MTRSTWTHPVAVIAIAAALALASCGGEDDAGSATFCDVAASYQAANAAPNPSTATAAELETTFTDLQDALDELQSAAPAEIEADVALVVSTFDDFIDALAEQDYDFAALTADPDGQAAVQTLNSDELGTAMGNIDDYIAAECSAATTG
jgi:hypothetical protein